MTALLSLLQDLGHRRSDKETMDVWVDAANYVTGGILGGVLR